MRLGSIVAIGALGIASVAPCWAVGPEVVSNIGVQSTESMPLRKLLEDFSAKVDAEILIDPSLATVVVPVPSEELTEVTVGRFLESVVRKLPRGSGWAVLSLPAKKRGYKFDDALGLLVLQNRMFGMRGDLQDGRVEIMGRKIDGQESSAIAATLELRRHFVIARSLKNAPKDSLDPSSPAFKQNISQAIKDVFSMEGEGRMEVLRSMWGTIKTSVDSMPRDERTAFLSGVAKEVGGPWINLIFPGQIPSKP